jgi:PhzF family phenazine biosynthesis protein
MKLDLVDVFADGALSGNPLAVVHGGGALDGKAMLALTRWLGFSETTFLLPPTEPGADYRVRIFYPAGELPFAGHPTLGSAAAWLAAGGQPQRLENGEAMIVQQCDAGLIDVRVEGDTLAFRAPPLRQSGPLDAAERAEAVRVAGVNDADVIAAVHANNGPGWRLLHMVSADAVLAARPVATAPIPTDVGLVGTWPENSVAARDRQWEVRAFFADANGRLTEDPVTGSLNASVGQYLLAGGYVTAPGYVAGQGQCIGADGRIAVAIYENAVWVGGKVRMVAQGAVLNLPTSAPT